MNQLGIQQPTPFQQTQAFHHPLTIITTPTGIQPLLHSYGTRVTPTHPHPQTQPLQQTQQLPSLAAQLRIHPQPVTERAKRTWQTTSES